MMHERIRVDDDDYSRARFVILKFPESGDDIRTPVLYADDGVELFSRDQLESMVTETFELWREVYGAACKTLIDSERRKNTQASSDVGARQLARF